MPLRGLLAKKLPFVWATNGEKTLRLCLVYESDTTARG